MKRKIGIGLVLLLLLTLCACGGKGGKGTELVLEAKNTVEDYAEFTLFKISTAKKITASLAGDIYYENKNEGETFVDVILDWTNTGSETMSSEDIVSASAVNAKGTKYTSCLYAVETNNATYLSQYENVTPLATVRLHCAIAVPEAETEVAILLNVDGNRYTYTYTLGETVSSAKPIAVGEAVEEEEYAALTFVGLEYTDDVLPSDTSSSYNHYEIDDTSNTYLVAKFDITNYMSDEKDCDAFIGVKALYLDKYSYTGFVVMEDEDKQGFSSYDSITPLSTRSLYYLIEVPKTVAEENVELTISFHGKEFTYTDQ